MQLLLQHGANISALDGSHSTPLHLASQQGKAETVQHLIERGADVNARNASNWTPLHLVVSHESAIAVQQLLRHGADNAQDENQLTPLHMASSSE